MIKTRRWIRVHSCLFVAQVVFAQRFDLATIKPSTSDSRPVLVPPVGDRFTATNVKLKLLLMSAYGLKNFELAGEPGWLGSDRFDLTAKADGVNLRDNPKTLYAMLRNLLQDRFRLKVHRETREVPVYVLLPAKGGIKLPNADPAGCMTYGQEPPTGQPPPPGCDGLTLTPNRIGNRRISMQSFAGLLPNLLERPVIDRTGYTGAFSVKLEFAADGGDDTSRPSIFTALQEQLGLRLESGKGPVELFVIDYVERTPVGN